jgi:Helix-turn-helix of DDE superfamily endonuclease/DDE superfamily endonuclease
LLFKSFTGLTVAEFDALCKDIGGMYKKYEIKRLSAKRRERRVGAGRPFKLCLQNRLLMLLIYYRMYITYTLTGFLFGIDQSNVCRDIQKIEPLVRQYLPIPQKLYRIAKRLKTQEEVEQYFPDFKYYWCNKSSKSQDPKIKEEKEYYSGKRKRHTVKQELMANGEGKILYKTHYKAGRNHDYKVYNANHPATPKQVENLFDLGFFGVDKDFPFRTDIIFILQKKK